jgi:alkylhydroperoxidase family enzyme
MTRSGLAVARRHTLGRMTRAALLWLAAVAASHSAFAEPRLAPLPQSDWTDEHRAAIASVPPGFMPNAVATYLHNPVLAGNVLPYLDYIVNESPLPARDRALLSLRTAWLARSNYLWAHLAAAARAEGLDDDDFERIAIGPGADGWTPFEAALLGAADELHVDSFIVEDTWQVLAAGYDDMHMIELMFLVGHHLLHAGAFNSLRLDIEPGVGDRMPYGIPRTIAAAWTNTRLIGAPPRIAPLAREHWTPELRAQLDPNDTGGPVANVFGTFVLNPEGDRLQADVGRHIRGANSLSGREAEVLILRTGVLTRAEYEWAAHSRIGRRLGMTDADVARIVAGPGSGGDRREAALLRAADELYRDDVVSDETWAELTAQFDTRQQLDVLIAVGGFRAVSIALNGAGVQLDANMADARFPPELR